MKQLFMIDFIQLQKKYFVQIMLFLELLCISAYFIQDIRIRAFVAVLAIIVMHYYWLYLKKDSKKLTSQIFILLPIKRENYVTLSALYYVVFTCIYLGNLILVMHGTENNPTFYVYSLLSWNPLWIIVDMVDSAVIERDRRMFYMGFTLVMWAIEIVIAYEMIHDLFSGLIFYFVSFLLTYAVALLLCKWIQS